MKKIRFYYIFKGIIYYSSLFILCCIVTFLILETGLRIGGAAWKYIFRAINSSNNNFYVYVIGGSTSVGDPYHGRVSFPKIISYMFEGKINGKDIKIINLAELGAALEPQYWKLYQELFIRPQSEGVLLVYSGINEEITDVARDPSFKYWKGVQKSILLSKALLLIRNSENSFIIDSIPFYHNSILKYEYKLEKTVKLAKKYGLRIILSTLAGNIADFPPNKVDIYRQEALESFNSAEKFENKGEFNKAIYGYKKIAKEYNIVSYHLGKCYEGIKLYEKAREYYHRAIDSGAWMRPTTGQNRIIKKIAKRYNINLADTAECFQEESPNGLLGYDLFVDAHHPNLKGYIILSRSIAREMQKIFNAETYHEPTKEDIIQYFNLNQDDYFNMYFSSVHWFCGVSSVSELTGEYLRMAEFYLKKMETIYPDSLDSYLGHLEIAVLKMNAEDAIYWAEKGKFLSENKDALKQVCWIEDRLEELLIDY